MGRQPYSEQLCINQAVVNGVFNGSHAGHCKPLLCCTTNWYIAPKPGWMWNAFYIKKAFLILYQKSSLWTKMAQSTHLVSDELRTTVLTGNVGKGTCLLMKLREKIIKNTVFQKDCSLHEGLHVPPFKKESWFYPDLGCNWLDIQFSVTYYASLDTE